MSSRTRGQEGPEDDRQLALAQHDGRVPDEHPDVAVVPLQLEAAAGAVQGVGVGQQQRGDGGGQPERTTSMNQAPTASGHDRGRVGRWAAGSRRPS